MLCSLLSLGQAGTFAMNKRYGISSEFIKNNTEQNVSEVASNVLRITNYTSKTVSFHLRFSIPMNWLMLKQSNAVYELAPGDSTFIPVRIITDKLDAFNSGFK